MPAEVQATIIALAGLNKLSGGAVSGIVGELSKGLVKGVLGMTAGVVNLKAGTVIGGGGGVIPGGKGGVAGKAGGALVTGRTFITGIAAGVLAGLAVELAGQLGQQSTEVHEQGERLIQATKANAPKMTERELVNAIQSIDDQLKNPLNAAALIITEPLNNGLSNLDKTQQALKAELRTLRANTLAGQTAASNTNDKRQAGIIEEQRRTKTAFVGGIGDVHTELIAEKRAAADGFGRTTSAVDRSRAGIVSATAQGAGTVASAVRASRPIVTTNVTVNVTAARVTASKTIQARYGPGNGSAQQNAREFG
jgi:hypothetical protein